GGARPRRPARGGVGNEFIPAASERLGLGPRGGRSGSQDLGGGIREVLNRGPKDRGFRNPGGLEDIVPACRYQRPADKHGVCQLIEPGKVSDTIEKEYACLLIHRRK